MQARHPCIKSKAYLISEKHVLKILRENLAIYPRLMLTLTSFPGLSLFFPPESWSPGWSLSYYIVQNYLELLILLPSSEWLRLKAPPHVLPQFVEYWDYRLGKEMCLCFLFETHPHSTAQAALHSLHSQGWP